MRCSKLSLSSEAGWVVEQDGTTYPKVTNAQIFQIGSCLLIASLNLNSLGMETTLSLSEHSVLMFNLAFFLTNLSVLCPKACENLKALFFLQFLSNKLKWELCWVFFLFD